MNLMQIFERIQLRRDERMLDQDITGHLGNAQPIKFPNSPLQVSRIRVLNATARNPRSAQSSVLTLGAAQIAGDASGVFQLRAHVEWGTGTTAPQAADVDLFAGTRLTLDASIVTVDAILTTLTGLGPGAETPTVMVKASIAYGTTSHGSSPTFTTFPVAGLAAGAVAVFDIPAFAKQMLPLMSGAGSTCTIFFPTNQVDIPANNLARVDIPAWIHGDGTVPQVAIKNTSAVAINLSTMFFLDL